MSWNLSNYPASCSCVYTDLHSPFSCLTRGNSANLIFLKVLPFNCCRFTSHLLVVRTANLAGIDDNLVSHGLIYGYTYQQLVVISLDNSLQIGLWIVGGSHFASPRCAQTDRERSVLVLILVSWYYTIYLSITFLNSALKKQQDNYKYFSLFSL